MILELGVTSNDLRPLQQKLELLGFPLGSIDGIFGKKTKESVIKFQKFIGHQQTGKLTESTLNILNVELNLLQRLSDYQKFINEDIYVSSGTGGEHKEGSFHYKALAVDILIVNPQRSLFEYYLDAERFNFSGIGVYPHWKYGDAQVGGLHLDRRPLIERGRSARWLGVKVTKEKDGKSVFQQHYIGFNLANLKKYKLV